MRVLLDTTAVRTGPSGTAVYVEQLARALDELGVTVLQASNHRRRPPGTGSVRNALEDARWTQIDLRRHAAQADVVHHPLPTLTVRGPRPQVVTVHDLAFEALPHAFDPKFRHYARTVHRLAVRYADAVVVPSHATARELQQRWGTTHAVVAPHGPGQQLNVTRSHQPRHFLYVGDAEPRKDVPTLLAAYATYRAQTEDPLPLVLAGRAHSTQPGVTTITEPDAQTLADLHAHARALVHPSRHEGFGLTVLEALHAGTPVIATDIPAIREIASGHARYVPPGDVAALAEALKDPPGAPAQPPPTPTWRDSALKHLEAYERARARRPVGSAAFP